MMRNFSIALFFVLIGFGWSHGFTLSEDSIRTYLIDLGNPLYPTSGNWNNVTSQQSNGTMISPLIDTAGALSTISFVIVDDADDGYGGGAGYNNEGYNGDAVGYPASAVRDSYFAWSTGGQYKFSGLSQGSVYDIKIFASRMATSGGRVGRYTINDESLNLDAWNNTTTTIQFAGVIPDVNGEIYMDFIVEDGSTFGYIGVIELTEHITNTTSEDTTNQSLSAYWTLDNSPNDVSGNNIHGIINGSPQFVESAIVGSHALELNGVDQYIDFGNPAQLPSGRSPRTMSAWIKTNSITGSWRFAVAYGHAANSEAMIIGQRETTLYGGAHGSDLSVADFLSVGAWHHVVLTYDGDTAKLYADGDKKVAMFKDWPLVLDKVYIGRQVNGSEYWNGAVDDVRIYYKALSDAEVLDLYNQDARNNLAAPLTLTVDKTPDQVHLTWQDNSYNEDGFIVERSENGSVFTHLGSTSANTSSYQDLTVVSGNYYQYRLFAFNTFMNSDTLVTDSLYILFQPNLVAHWELDNNANDESGNDFHGTIQGNPQFVESAIVGSHAIELNGVNQYVDFGNPAQLPSGRSPRSMSGWIKTNSITGSWRFAITYGHSANSEAMIIGQRETTLYGGAHGSDLSVADFLSVGAWHHVVLTYDGDTAKLYADGVERVAMYKNWPLVLDKVYIGRQVNGSEYWNGAVDDVRIYDKALSGAEVLNLYRQKPVSPSNLVVNSAFSNAAELAWVDNSDNEDGFLIERKDGETGTFVVLDTVVSNVAYYKDYSLDNDSTYYYRVSAFLGLVTSNYSNEITVVSRFEGLIPDNIEYQALVDIYESTNGQNWTNKTNWLSGETHEEFDNWFGVGVGNGDIKSLYIRENNLSGDIPASIGNLTELIILDFAQNQLSSIPNSIGKLNYLKGLFLESNNISLIPDSIVYLDRVIEIYLNDNRINSFPKIGSPGCLFSLLYLLLNDNEIEGTVPDNLANIYSLRHLDLSNNNLVGDFPDLHSRCLRWINISNNKISSIPRFANTDCFVDQSIYVQGNNLDFSSIERNFSYQDTHPFYEFDYSDQGVIGETDTLEILEQSFVELLSNIEGQYTHYQWQKYTGSTWVDVSGATGSLLVFNNIQLSDSGNYRCVATNDWVTDLTLYTATKTIKVTVDENYDQIPDTQELQALTAIFSKLGGEEWTDSTNWLNGNSSSDFAGWYGITVENGDVTEVDLQGNNLKGEIPPEIQQLGSLRVLRLNNNQLKGEIPVQLARLENLEELYLNDNQLEGYMDLEFSVMPNIRVMALQNNNLVSIPDFSFKNSVDPLQVTLNVENNKLEFYYIENNLNTDGSNILGTFTYMPQKTYGEPRILGFIVGNELVLKVNMLGRANHYQWQFSSDQGQNWTDRGTDDPEYTETGIGESQEGWYRVKITNDRANEAGDEIESAIYNVRIEKAPVVVNRPVD